MTNNHQLILSYLFNHPGAIRKNILDDLKLRRNTVSETCAELIKDKKIIETNGNQKKNVTLKLNPKKFLTLGVQHDKSIIRIVALNSDLKIAYKKIVPISKTLLGTERCEKIAQIAANTINKGLNRKNLLKIGFADIGMVDRKSGISVTSIMLEKWENIPTEDIIISKTGIGTKLYNIVDSKCAVELMANGNKDEFLFATIGTGIGLSIVSDHKLFHSGNGIAGEMGHIVVEENGKICKCGNRGCLETVASTTAVIEKVKNNLQNGKKDVSLNWIIDQAGQGHKLCRLAVEEAADAVASVLSGFVNTIGTTNIVIGSKFTENSDIFNSCLKNTLSIKCIYPLNNRINIKGTIIKDFDGATGAAFLCMKDYFSEGN